MHAYLTDVQKEIKELADRFSREKLLPRYMERERNETAFDRNLMKEMGKLGLLGAEAPEKWGGMGLDSVTAGVICESIGYGDFNYSYLPLAASLAIAVLDAYASPELAGEWIPKLISGEALIPVALGQSALAYKFENCVT